MAFDSNKEQVEELMDDLIDQVSDEYKHDVVPTVDNWSVKWPTWTNAGPGHKLTWESDEQEMLHYRQLLGQYGYTVGKFIADRRGHHDHQLILVTKPVNYACKVVSMGFYRRKYKNIDQSVVAFRRESDILLRMNHPNIIQTIDHIELSDRQTGFPYNYAALVLELMDGTVTELRLTLSDRRIPEWLCRILARDVLLALDYMHNTGPGKPFTVVHMAIASRNILYRVVHSGALISYLFKLADFEECCIYEGNEQQLMPESKLEKPYVTNYSPPELEDGQIDRLRQMLTPPMDIYSLGSIVYSLFAHRIYSTKNYHNTFTNRNEPPMGNFIYSLTRTHQDHRLTAREALQHQWLQQ
ncbi:caM kinase-like vesicle-associated protein [Oppia nitens]|uniref:caM kinase-like vesicle-associated protein n=1 Tax=Oppia nitens TaxID=1686743 RepID=UPI0023DA12B9|nr:caM kinase-like vesicle-associated protein [Oppia nitens]